MLKSVITWVNSKRSFWQLSLEPFILKTVVDRRWQYYKEPLWWDYGLGDAFFKDNLKRETETRRDRFWRETERQKQAKDLLGDWKRFRACIGFSKTKLKMLTDFLTYTTLRGCRFLMYDSYDDNGFDAEYGRILIFTLPLLILKDYLYIIFGLQMEILEWHQQSFINV